MRVIKRIILNIPPPTSGLVGHSPDGLSGHTPPFPHKRIQKKNNNFGVLSILHPPRYGKKRKKGGKGPINKYFRITEEVSSLRYVPTILFGEVKTIRYL